MTINRLYRWRRSRHDLTYKVQQLWIGLHQHSTQGHTWAHPIHIRGLFDYGNWSSKSRTFVIHELIDALLVHEWVDVALETGCQARIKASRAFEQVSKSTSNGDRGGVRVPGDGGGPASYVTHPKAAHAFAKSLTCVAVITFAAGSTCCNAAASGQQAAASVDFQMQLERSLPQWDRNCKRSHIWWNNCLTHIAGTKIAESDAMKIKKHRIFNAGVDGRTDPRLKKWSTNIH